MLVNVGKNGAFTASLQIGGRKVQWTGTFTMSVGGGGTWIGTVTDAVLGPLELRLELPPGGGQMTVTLTNDGQTNTASLVRAGQLGRGEVPAGNYTVLLPANPDFPGAGHPQGDGYATLGVTTSGLVKLVGKLGDGTTISQSGPLTSDGRFQVFIPLYKGGGILSGWIDFVPIDEVSDFNGTLQWSKPAVTGDAFYSSGFDFEIDLLGSKFTRPRTGQRILSLQDGDNNGVLLLGDGNLGEPLTKSLTLNAANKVQFPEPGPELPVFTITVTSGLFTGSFLHPQLGKRAKFTGVVFQKQHLASGVFRGQSESGYVTLYHDALSSTLLPSKGNAVPGNENVNQPFRGTRWRTEDGGNGHYYELVTGAAPITWQAARDAAVARGGHLVTVTSAEENVFVTTLMNGTHILAGGFQSPGATEPAEGWQWVTGEPFQFTGWNSGEPSNSGNNEHFLEIYPGSTTNWNDLPNEALILSYMVEYE